MSWQIEVRYLELENQAGNMDPIANMLTSIRNAQAVKHESVRVPYSKVNFGILETLKREGWIENIELKKKEGKSILSLKLKYTEDGRPKISALQRVSKLGKRIYVKKDEIPSVRNNYGLAILSTPQGIMTGKEARKRKVGGEVLCKIW